MARRAYGTGSLYVRRDGRGREYWYGQWWAGDRRPRRRIGPKRPRGSRDGLTRSQAERQLRKLIDAESASSSPLRIGDRPSLVEVAERYIDHREQVMERKRTTIEDYRSITQRHFARFFADKAIERIRASDIESYMRARRAEGLAPKTIQNQLNLLNAIFRFAVRHGWAPDNPVAQVERPKKQRHHERRIQFLQPHELDRLINAVAEDALGQVDRVLYLCAAYTGLRQGELLGLRWIDIDWVAMRIRVADNYTRGHFTSPKSDEGRSVPMATQLAAELERLFQNSAYQEQSDSVFCHPQTGHPYDPSKLRKRFYEAMKAAGMGDRCGRNGGITFHALRHTFGTQLAAAGAPLRAIQEWMGHADAKTTEIYRHYAPDPTQGADLVERAFGPRSAVPPRLSALGTGRH